MAAESPANGRLSAVQAGKTRDRARKIALVGPSDQGVSGIERGDDLGRARQQGDDAGQVLAMAADWPAVARAAREWFTARTGGVDDTPIDAGCAKGSRWPAAIPGAGHPGAARSGSRPTSTANSPWSAAYRRRGRRERRPAPRRHGRGLLGGARAVSFHRSAKRSRPMADRAAQPRACTADVSPAACPRDEKTRGPVKGPPLLSCPSYKPGLLARRTLSFESTDRFFFFLALYRMADVRTRSLRPRWWPRATETVKRFAACSSFSLISRVMLLYPLFPALLDRQRSRGRRSWRSSPAPPRPAGSS